VVYRAPYSEYFHTDMKLLPAIEFLVEVLQHLPDTRAADSFAPTGCTPLGLVARGPVALTSCASLPRAGSTTINPGHPPASVRPTSRSQSCRCRPGRAAPHGPA
jgi:hypothetical protein